MTIETNLAIWGAGIIATTAASWASLFQRLIDKENRDEERFKRVEVAVGIANSNGAAFVRTAACTAAHTTLQRDLDRVEARIEHAIERGEVAINESRENRSHIEERLSTIERKINHGTAGA